MPYSSKDASAATSAINRDAVARYDLANREDFTAVDRGLVAPLSW